MEKEYEMLQQELRNRERAWDDFDGKPADGNGEYPDLDKAGVIELLNLFRKRLQVVELENTRLKLKLWGYEND